MPPMTMMDRVVGWFRREAPKPTVDQGVMGTQVYGGFVTDGETSPALSHDQRYKTYHDTVVNVSIVGAAVRHFLGFVAKSDWNVAPPKKETGREAQDVADFVLDVMHDMDRPWFSVTRKAALSRFYGFSLQEPIAKKRDDGQIGYRGVYSRPQHTIERWDVDSTGHVRGVVQRGVNDGLEYYIPRAKLVYMVDDSLNDSPEGVGLVRHVMEDVRYLLRALQLEGWGYETNLHGIPVGRAPLSLLNQQVKDGKITPDERTLALKGIRGFLQNHVKTPQLAALLDSVTYQDKLTGDPSTEKMFDLELLTTEGGTSFEAINKVIDRTTRNIARPLGAEWLLLGGDGKGSLALSEDKTAMWGNMLSGTLSEIAWTYREDYVKRLLGYNGIDLRLCPELMPDPVQLRDVLQITKALTDLAQAGATLLPNDPVVFQVRGMLNLAEPPQEDMDKLADQTLNPPDPNAGEPDVDVSDMDADTEKAAIQAVAKNGKGVMIGLFLPKSVAEKISLVGGSDWSSMHVTLAYLGKGIPEDEVARTVRAVKRVAAGWQQLQAKVGGLGRFSLEPKDAFYASVDGGDVTEFRAQVVSELHRMGIGFDRTHGFTPHVTLAWLDKDAWNPINRLDPVAVTFGSVFVAAGHERVEIPLGG